jgi:phage-related protein
VVWRVEILEEAVSELDAWPAKARAALDKIVERIEVLGMDRLHEPHVKHIQGKMWEMRPCAAGNDGRALYVTVSGQRVVIVAAFMKKTRRTPKRWIDVALGRAKGIT